MKLFYQIATILGRIAELSSISINVPMAVAITDSEGGLLYFLRMINVLPVSTEISISKAYTAAVLRMPTHKVGELAQPGEMLYGIQNSTEKKIVIFGGGIPLYFENQVMGAIGISGGTVQEDIMVAEVVEDSFKKMRSCLDVLTTVIPENFRDKIDNHLLRRALHQAVEGKESEESKISIEILKGAMLLFPNSGAKAE